MSEINKNRDKKLVQKKIEAQQDYEKSKISVEENNNNLPHEKSRAFDNLKFSGRNDSQHPEQFIKDFEKLVVQEDLNDWEKQIYFIKSLVGEATTWIEANRYENFDGMKKGFLNFYWSSENRQSFLDHLENGKYNKNCGLSMSEYFFKYFNGAKFLKNAPTEETLISDLLNHFDFEKEIIDALELQSVKTVEEVLNVLDVLRNDEAGKVSEIKQIKTDSKSTLKKGLSKIYKFMKNSSIYLTIWLAVFYSVTYIGNYSKENVISNFVEQSKSLSLPISGTSINKKFEFTKNLKFSGTIDSTHPRIFIENFEHLAAYENWNCHDKKKIFIQSLVDDPANWLKVRGYGTYKEMKEAFLRYYWSKENQEFFLDYLKGGKYDENSGLSLTTYFFKYANEARFLDEALTEEEVVSYLINHFDFKKEILRALEIRPLKTIEETLKFLTKVDSEKGSYLQGFKFVWIIEILFFLMYFVCGFLTSVIIFELRKR